MPIYQSFQDKEDVRLDGGIPQTEVDMKADIGDMSKVAGIGDGTLAGAISSINADLTNLLDIDSYTIEEHIVAKDSRYTMNNFGYVNILIPSQSISAVYLLKDNTTISRLSMTNSSSNQTTETAFVFKGVEVFNSQYSSDNTIVKAIELIPI